MKNELNAERRQDRQILNRELLEREEVHRSENIIRKPQKLPLNIGDIINR